MPRLATFYALVICAIAAMPGVAAAELSGGCKASLSGKRMTLIVPNAAGGGYDTYARALAPVIDEISGLSTSVINMPAAGGLVALTTLVNSGQDELVMMVENGTDVLRTVPEAGAAPWFARLQQLGVFHAEPSAWVGKAGLDIGGTQELVAASSSVDSEVEFVHMGDALGLEIKLISGYGGSKETEAAVLRGEADLISGSLSTSLKAAKSGDLSLKILLSDKPSERAPGVPHAAGEDGLVAKLAKDLAADERARRMELARLVADLSFDVRTVFTHKALNDSLRDCLAETVNAAIRAPGFASAAEAQGRPVTPMEPAQAAEMLAAQLKSLAKLQSLTAAP